MANTFVSVKDFARAALPRLIEHLVFPNLIYKDYSDDFAARKGDTIQVRLTCKRKTLKKQRTAEEKPTGVVEWAVEIFNQHQQAVALYSILTLVARQRGEF